MPEKHLEGKHKANIMRVIMFIVVLLVIIVAPLFFFSNKDKDNDTVNSNETLFEVETTEELIDLLYSGELSATQMQVEMNKYLGHSPNFSVEEENKNDAETEVERTEEIDSVLKAYLDGLFIQQKKLSRVADGIREELITINDLSDDAIRDEVKKISGYDSPLVDGLLTEMNNTPLFINSEDDNFQVWVDYETVNREYDDYFTEYHKNLTKLHKDIMRFGYTRDDGKIDVRHVYNRLSLLDEIQDGDVTKDDFFWEKERYQHAVLLTGYGDETKPNWDEKRIEQMEEIMLGIDEDSVKELGPYQEIVSSLLASIKEENGYGENTIRIANKWMHEQFSEYRMYLEENEISDK